MVKIIDYYICLISPYTYMGDARLHEIATNHGADINYCPVNLGGVFPETGGLPLAKRAPARQAYRMQELKRWRAFLNIELNTTPKHFPTNEWPAAGVVIAAQQNGMDCGPLVSTFLTAVWAKELDIGDQNTIVALADEQGFDGKALLKQAEDPAIRQVWDDNTAKALDAGVFGAPSYIFDGELYWGQDRLDFLDRALGA